MDGQLRTGQAGIPPVQGVQLGQFATPYPVYLVDPRQSQVPSQPDYHSQYEAIKNSVSSVLLNRLNLE